MLETATISSVMEFVFYCNNGIVYNISRTSFAFQPTSHVHHEKATLSLLFVRIQGSMRNHCSSTWDVNNSLQCCNKKPVWCHYVQLHTSPTFFSLLFDPEVLCFAIPCMIRVLSQLPCGKDCQIFVAINIEVD